MVRPAMPDTRATPFGPMSAASPAVAAELLSQSPRSRVWRELLPDGRSVIGKQALGADALRRIAHEREVLQRLGDLPGVARLADAELAAQLPQAPDLLWLADDRGVPLSELLPGRPLSLAALLRLARSLVHTLAALHRRGLAHLDINPSNILVAGAEQRPVLIDFNLAGTAAESGAGTTPPADLAGTLAYMAPEQTGRSGRGVDHRADLYALGATLYEAATGHRPFEIDDPLALIHAQLARMPRPPGAWAPALPPALSDILMRLLEKDADARYQSAEGLAADLARLEARLAQGQRESFVLGERDFALRLAPPARLVGRDAELAALAAALDSARQLPGQLLLIDGAPGVGKTALLAELRAMVKLRRGWFVSGKFDQFRRAAAEGAGVQALRSLGAQLLAEPEEVLAALRPRLLQALGANAGVLAGGLPELALVLGCEPQPLSGDTVQGLQRFRQGVLDLLRTVSTDRPLVMVLDDLQWAARRTFEFIDAILNDGALPGVLVVGTYRDADIDAAHPMSAMLERWAQRRPPPARVALRNLPLGDLSLLLQQMMRLPPEPALALAGLVAERTDGNPYDSVELVNALRHEGLLRPDDNGWRWEAEAVRRYIGQGDVLDLLSARIDRLPASAQAVLEAQSCLGSEATLPLLAAAVGLEPGALREALAPAAEDGLVLLGADTATATGAVVRFRHDRVQQAAYARLAPEARDALHLAMARRLSAHPGFADRAAEQYLPAVALLQSATECRRVVALFRQASVDALLTNHQSAERLTAAARALLRDVATPQDAPLQLALGVQHIGALYALGRHEALDEVYAGLEAQGHAPSLLAGAACTRLKSLGDRRRHAEAMDFGLGLLRRLGLDLPQLDQADAAADDEAQWAAFYRRALALDIAADTRRAPIQDARLLGIAELLERLLVTAYFMGSRVAAPLLFEGQRLWSEHGPCASLVNVLAGAVGPLIAIRQDFALSYRLLQHALAIGTARHWEPQTSDTRHYLALLAMPWFEPLEQCHAMEQQAREGLVQWGLRPQAAYTHIGTVITTFECAPTLEATTAAVAAGIGFAQQVGNPQAGTTLPLYRQQARALRGLTPEAGRLGDADFDEAAYASGAHGPLAQAGYHVHAALLAAIFDDDQALAHHAGRSMALASRQAHYRAAHAHLLHGLSLAQRARGAPPGERQALLEAAAPSLDWLRRRAADAPANFAHLATWIEAELAWSREDMAAAGAAFTEALRPLQSGARPWHRAIVTEHAGRFFLAHGPQSLGRHLIEQARQLYADWGASAKARALVQTHAFLRQPGAAGSARPRSGGRDSDGPISAETLDMAAILRASQALSSETSLGRLKARLAELLGALTGASSVLLVLRGEDGAGWFVSEASDDAGASIRVEEAAERGLLPISAFRYALRTRAPLVVEDAPGDDRFARDPYVVGCAHCALLVVPILSHGEPRAVLMLENRLARGAFTADRLDTVTLIAGQLAVSLDNALLYASLERKVAQRTAELQDLVSGLESFNRSISHDLRGPLGGIAGLATLAGEALERGDDSVARRVLPTIARQAGASARLVAALLALARVGDAQLHRQPVEIAALVREALDQFAQAEPDQALPLVTVNEVPTVFADVELLRPVMVNLLGNAIKFVRGRPAPHIEVSGRLDEHEVTVSVCDNGIGFESEAAQALFQPFTRLHGKAFEGHGVGLSIVRRAVERHGGRVWARSAPEQGACFYFTLPRADPADPEGPVHAA